ncbi:acid phosphatase/Vanadium-dependent haloperoxidase [Phlegmacium glaucopus]|nr:acid phosphatase/Vanadium-dependent haloperoxidase [Phlegmacium glaucopus]
MFPFKPTHPSARRPISPTRRNKLLLSYAPDWVITIVLAALFLLLDNVDGFRRDFSVTDTSIRHPFAVHERVPNLALYLIAVLSPLIIMALVNFVTVRSWWDFHNGSILYSTGFLGLALTGAVTEVVKLTVGRPRPDLLDRCQLPAGISDPPYKLTNSTLCTQTDIAIMRDGFRSFPSGHSSLSFAGLGFLGFYLAGKLHLFDSKGHTGKAWIAVTPFVGAALVAISRTMDNRHHWHDVLVGSILGTVLAYFSYRQYYPGLASKFSHRPYSPRIKREDDELLPIHNLHSFGGDQGLHGVGGPASHDDHDDALAGTVPRLEAERLEDVWRERYDGVQTADENEDVPYGDSLRLGSRVPASSNAPYISNLQTIPIAAKGPQV